MNTENLNLDGLYAHSRGTDKSDWQTLSDHLENVAQLASLFAKPFGGEQLARVAGLLHDLGKADKEFQSYLENSTLKDFKGRCHVNHSEAGAAYASSQICSSFKNMIANIVVGHHTGLADHTGGASSYLNRIEEGKKEFSAIEKQVSAFLQTLPDAKTLIPTGFKPNPEFKKYYHFLVRFLFSCLVDADWLDTERFCDPKRYELRPKYPPLSQYLEQFNAHMADLAEKVQKEAFEPNSPHAILNQMRNQILEDCRAKGRESVDHGLYSLAVPTGGGKTLSSMAFALEHAIKHRKDRIIYVIPYTSIIEQNAKVFREIFGASAVVEHHSGISDFESKEGKSKQDTENETVSLARRQMELATENWDAPLIVTTNVQFFESLFACHTKRCRKLHNIANSVVILDEAQMLKPELLSVCNHALNELSEQFKTTFVLCTATQPALDSQELAKPGSEYLPLNTPELINSNPNILYESLRRVEYHVDLDTTISWDALAEKLVTHEQVLCIVNTRKDCYELYKSCEKRLEGGNGAKRNYAFDVVENNSNNDVVKNITTPQSLVPNPQSLNLYHLSALMCPAHRTQQIAEIKQRLADGVPVCVISTQLVEAGVDIDFPVVYRAKAGLDSILQSGGRCNREGKLDGLGQVYVFTPESQIPTGTMSKSAGAFNEIWYQKPDIQNPDTYRKYSQLYIVGLNSTRDINISDSAQRLDVIESLWKEPMKIPYRTIGENLKWIDDDYSVPVVTMYEEGTTLIERLKREGPHKELMRQIQRYSVNVPWSVVNKLCQTGSLLLLDSGIIVQNSTALYDDEFGLDLFETESSKLLVI